MNKPTFRYVQEGWDDAHAATLDPLGRLVYRSNLLGSDQRITNTGGGNTSAKYSERDPLSGEPVDVLWVKGSGGDLRTCTRDHFASLFLPRLDELRRRYLSAGERAVKSPEEDAMVGRYPHAAFRLNSPAPSIDTPLHAFLPGRHVDHVHPNAIIAIAASERCEELTREIFGGTVGYVPWMRPGFELGLAMQEVARKQPNIRAIMMAQHGLIAWADDDRECYWSTLGLHRKKVFGKRGRFRRVRRNCSAAAGGGRARADLGGPPPVPARPSVPAAARRRHRAAR
jgi:rhamnose utilization protein RhaD (predicted bifunctional aldolase and dehydrogenase)